MSDNSKPTTRTGVTVTLGGQDYEIRPLPMGYSRRWRDDIAGPFSALIEALQAAPNMALDDLQSIMQLVNVMKDVLLGSIDICIEALFAYSPALAADRERIEAEAYDDEAIAAFIEVVKLAYPFGEVLKLVPTIRSQPATRKKSR